MLQLVRSVFHNLLTCEKIPTTRAPMRETWQPASLSSKIKFPKSSKFDRRRTAFNKFRGGLIILIRLRSQVSRQSESICTTVHTKLHSSQPHKQGSWPISPPRNSIVASYVAIALRRPSLHQHHLTRRCYLPLTASSEQPARHHYRGRSHRYVAIALRLPPIPLDRLQQHDVRYGGQMDGE